MPYFSTELIPLFYSFSLPPQERGKIDCFLSVLENSGFGQIQTPVAGINKASYKQDDTGQGNLRHHEGGHEARCLSDSENQKQGGRYILT